MSETLRYSLSKDDYLEYYLYISSTNKKTTAKRRRNWIVLSLSFSVFTSIIFIENYTNLKPPFLILTFATIFLYPFYEKWQFRKYYTDYITDNFSNRINSEFEIIFDEKQVVLIDKTGENKINKSELTEIAETGRFFFIGVSSGGHIIIPKYKFIENKWLTKSMDDLLLNYKVPVTRNLTWHFK